MVLRGSAWFSARSPQATSFGKDFFCLGAPYREGGGGEGGGRGGGLKEASVLKSKETKLAFRDQLDFLGSVWRDTARK